MQKIKINLKINGETHKYSSKTLRWLSRQINTLFKTVERNSSGSCIVNYGKGYKNEFEFSNYTDFYYKLKPCIELGLIKEFS